MIEKYIQDNKAAILYSPGFGAGWSTWDKEEISYDKRIVEKFLAGADEKEMKSFLNEIGYKDVYMGGYKQLKIKWLPVGTKYIIYEYDGNESIQTIESLPWIEV